MSTVDDVPTPDTGSALAIVLGAVVVSSALTWSLVERMHVVARTTDAQIESVRRRAAVEGAVLAAAASGPCATTSWEIDRLVVEVTCTPVGSADTDGATDGSTDVAVVSELYTGADGEGADVVRVSVRRDAAGHPIDLEWDPDGVGPG